MGFGPGDRDRVGPELIGEGSAVNGADHLYSMRGRLQHVDVSYTAHGEALQELPQEEVDARKQRREAEKAVQALKKAAARVEPSGEDEMGARLREALPRAVAAHDVASRTPRYLRTRRWIGARRRHAVQLLSDVYASDGRNLPKWLRDSSIDAPLIVALEGVNARKRLPCEAKLNQLVAMRDALGQGKAKDSNPSCASYGLPRRVRRESVVCSTCCKSASTGARIAQNGGAASAAAKNEPEKPAVTA